MSQIEELLETMRDAKASRLLEALDDELAWTARFAATKDDQWDRLAELARQDIAAGDMVSLEAGFPGQAPKA